MWRAPRIHGDLQKLGITVSERTVSRVLGTVKRPPSQTWRTFLQNHIQEIVAIDFFTVPTIRPRVLFVFLVMEHQRRRVLHFGITEHPTAGWTAQQMTEAFSERDVQHYLIRDRDSICGGEFRRSLQSLSIREVVTTRRSPWQNAFAERLIGSIRRATKQMPAPAEWIEWRRLNTVFTDLAGYAARALSQVKSSYSRGGVNPN